jgi:AcrR family transcriptional regulator
MTWYAIGMVAAPQLDATSIEYNSINRVLLYSVADVKTGRRQRQAQLTRRRIRTAAAELFVQRGYASTTVQQIAERADVAWQTVYAVFGNKAAILSEIFDVTVAGDDDPIPVAQRQFVRDIEAATERRDKARIFARHLRETNARTTAVQSIIEAAAATDAEMAALWTKLMQQLTVGMRMAALAFHNQGALRTDITVDKAADLLWWHTGPWAYRALVLTKGWTDDEFEQWMTDVVYDQLMRE